MLPWTFPNVFVTIAPPAVFDSTVDNTWFATLPYTGPGFFAKRLLWFWATWTVLGGCTWRLLFNIVGWAKQGLCLIWATTILWADSLCCTFLTWEVIFDEILRSSGSRKWNGTRYHSWRQGKLTWKRTHRQWKADSSTLNGNVSPCSRRK